jgi:hypothetical protein
VFCDVRLRKLFLQVCVFVRFSEKAYVCTPFVTETSLRNYVYVCMHVCMYVSIYVCVLVWTYICMYVCMFVCMCIYVRMKNTQNICMHVCMYACMHVRMYVRMYVRMQVFTHVCMYAWIYGSIFDGPTSRHISMCSITIHTLSLRDIKNIVGNYMLVPFYSIYNYLANMALPFYFI